MTRTNFAFVPLVLGIIVTLATSSCTATEGQTPAAPGAQSLPAAAGDPALSPIPISAPGKPGLVVGHRGNAAGAPEDTLASEVSASKVGANVLEFDLHMTSDNVPIVMHDDDVDRTTNGWGRIGQLTLDQIKQFDAGSSYSPAFAGIRVPTFEEILQFASKSKEIILPEFKEQDWTDEQIGIVADLVDKYHMTKRTMFQSFWVPVLQQAARIAPNISRAGLVSDAPSDPVAYIRAFAGQGLLPKYATVTKELVSTLHAADMSIMVWTVDDPDEWAALTTMGVDGIMSNNPGALSGWIRAQ